MEEKKELSVSFTADVGTIETDQFPRIKDWVSQITEPYRNAIVSKDSVRAAKDDLANLRKLQTKLEDERKRIKKLWNAPYTMWEEGYKDAVAGLAEAISNLDVQVKSFTEAEKAEAAEAVRAAILQDAHDFGLDVEMFVKNNPAVFDRIYKDEYSNKSFSRNKATAEWRDALRQVQTDLEQIGNDDLLVSFYAESGNLGLAMKKLAEVKARNQAFIEAKKQPKDEPARARREILIDSANSIVRIAVRDSIKELSLKGDDYDAKLQRQGSVAWRISGPAFLLNIGLAVLKMLGLKIEKEAIA